MRYAYSDVVVWRDEVQGLAPNFSSCSYWTRRGSEEEEGTVRRREQDRGQNQVGEGSAPIEIDPRNFRFNSGTALYKLPVMEEKESKV